MATRLRSRTLLLYACLVVIFGPSLFLSWRTYQLADRITAVESFEAESTAGCPAIDRALAATWSDTAARQIGGDRTGACAAGPSAMAGAEGIARRSGGSACAADGDAEDLGDTFGVFTGRIDDACGLRQTALMTFRTTLALTLLAAALAVMTLRREF